MIFLPGLSRKHCRPYSVDTNNGFNEGAHSSLVNGQQHIVVNNSNIDPSLFSHYYNDFLIDKITCHCIMPNPDQWTEHGSRTCGYEPSCVLRQLREFQTLDSLSVTGWGEPEEANVHLETWLVYGRIRVGVFAINDTVAKTELDNDVHSLLSTQSLVHDNVSSVNIQSLSSWICPVRDSSREQRLFFLIFFLNFFFSPPPPRQRKIFSRKIF